MSSGHPRVVTIPGAATVQTNQPAPAQFSNSRTQYSGSTSYADSTDAIDQLDDPVANPPVPPDPRVGHVKMYGVSGRGIVARMPDGTLVPSQRTDLHVERGCPVGELLTTSNFHTALDAMLALAYTMDVGARIIVPEGVWPYPSLLHLPGRPNSLPIPLIVGSARGASIIEFPTNLTGPCAYIDHGDITNGELAYLGGFQHITLRAAGASGVGIGLKIRSAAYSILEHVNVEGWGDPNTDGWSGGVGIWVDGNRSDISHPDLFSENTMNCSWHHVTVSGCQAAIRTRAFGPGEWRKVECNQNRAHDVLLEGGNQFSWLTGEVQGGQETDTRSPYYGLPRSRIRTVGDPRAQFAAAVLSAPVAGVVTVTGLSELAMSAAHVRGYLRIKSATDTRNQGFFEIQSVPSSSSVTIAKANGSAETCPAELLLNGGGNRIYVGPHVYLEGGGTREILRTNPHQDTFDQFALDGISVGDAQHVADCYGTAAVYLSRMDGSPSVSYFIGRLCGTVRIDDQNIGDPENTTALDIDATTRAGLTVISAGYLYSGRRSQRKTLLDLLRPVSFEAWDATAYGTLGMSSSEVNSFVGAIAGSTFTAANGNRRLVFIAKHPDLGGGAAVGIRRYNSKTQSCTLVNPVPIGSLPGVLFVGALPKGYTPGWVKRGPCLWDGAAGADVMTVGIDDGDGGGIRSFRSRSGEGLSAPGFGALPASGAIAFLAQHEIVGNGPLIQPTAYLLKADGTVQRATGASGLYTTGAVMNTVQLASDPGDTGNGNDYDLQVYAVLKRPLSSTEVLELFAMIAERRGQRSQGVALSPLLTATPGASVDRYGNRTIYRVNLAGAAGDVVLPLPAANEGDEVWAKIVGAASGRTLTVDPDGAVQVEGAATLVLSADNDGCHLVFDGAGWLRLKS